MSRSLLAVLLLLPALALAADSPAPEGGGLESALEQSGGTSPEQKQAFAAAAVTEIGAAVHAVEKLLADQQKEKDKNTESVECLERKLTPLKTLNDVATQSNMALKSAITSADSVHADQEYRKVAVALSKARDFLAEAHACVGDTGARTGDNVVAMDDGSAGSEPNLPDDTMVDVPPPVSAN